MSGNSIVFVSQQNVFHIPKRWYKQGYNIRICMKPCTRICRAGNLNGQEIRMINLD